jgi:hypothetical protein
MAKLTSGRTVPLSLPRRFIGDLIHRAHQVPLATAERRLHLGEVARARGRSVGRPGWCALFTRGVALLASRRPVLRRTFVPLPRPHLYENPFSIASVAVARPFGMEEAVFFTHIRAPENQTLPDIDRHLRQCKERPLEDCALFRRILKTSCWPQPIRRLVWWSGTQLSGSRKARHLGTFGISVVSNFGAASPHLLTPLTTALNYGVIGADGQVDVYLTFDQRVLDAPAAGKLLAELEAVFRGEILDELKARAWQ